MSRLIAFYRGQEPDTRGRTIDDMWSWDHRRLEMIHDYIQWLFPLPEPSRFNPGAPLLSDRDIAVLQGDPVLQDRVRRSLDLMLDFFGLQRKGAAVSRGADFARVPWLEPLNHNHLRLTRILLFLRHAGLRAEAQGLRACLEDIAAHEGRDAITPRTLAFWRAAV
ncbi:MAG: hypothetical protein K1X51_01595 [Rhodospirillaceae bacterium]|nr:hypothetical protein [Rhodospirillaceae bacterium]